MATPNTENSVTIATSQIRLLFRRLFLANEGNKNGNRINAAAAPGNVSVKTTVITYVPVGVEDEVVIVSAPVLDE